MMLTPASPQTRSSPRAAVVIPGLLLLTVLTLWPVVVCQFTNFDDDRYITANLTVQKGLTLEGLHYAFFSTDATYWHPITWLLHMLDVQVFGIGNPGAHHAVNLLFHLINVALLWWVVRRLTGWTWTAVWVAAVFAVHPMHVETVAWIAERKGVVSGMFFLLTIAAYQHYTAKPGVKRYLLVTAAFLAALMSKPITVTLPGVLLMLDLWPLRRIDLRTPGWGRAAWRCILEKLPWLAMSLAVGVLTVVFAAKEETVMLLPWSIRGPAVIVSYAAYVWMLFWPANLTAVNPYPAAFPKLVIIASAGLLLTVTAAAVAMLRSRPVLFAGWFFFVGIVLPVSGILTISDEYMADRYTYLSHIGLLLVIGSAGVCLAKRYPRATATLACVSVALLAVAASRQVWTWQDSLTLMAQGQKVYPDSWTANLNYAAALADNGREEEAGPYLKRAAASGARVLPHTNYARWLLQRGRIAEAENHAAIAGSVDAEDPDFLSIAGRLELRNGRPEVAAALFTRAIQKSPAALEAHTYLGRSLLDLGRLPEAEAATRQALAIEPNQPVALHTLGHIALRSGHRNEAARLFLRAFTVKPEYIEARLDYADLLRAEGYPKEAAEALAPIDALPATPVEQARASVLRLPAGDGRNLPYAVGLLKEAIAADPADPTPRYWLAVFLSRGEPSPDSEQAARNAYDAAVRADHRQYQRNLRAMFPAVLATQPTTRP